MSEHKKEKLKSELRRELKIKEGAENLAKVAANPKHKKSVAAILKASQAKINELQELIQQLNAEVAEVGKLKVSRVEKSETVAEACSCHPLFCRAECMVDILVFLSLGVRFCRPEVMQLIWSYTLCRFKFSKVAQDTELQDQFFLF